MKRTILATTLIVFAAGVAGAISALPDKPDAPLAGTLERDFGDVNFNVEAMEINHVFELTNVTSDVIAIDGIATTCGCTLADASSHTVEPDESITVSATLKFADVGRRSETIWVNVRDHGVLALKLSGNARRLHDVYASHSEVSLHESGVVSLIATERTTDDEPIAPTVRAPAGISADFLGWKRITWRDPDGLYPARWQATVQLTRSANAEPGDLVIQLGDSRELTVRLTHDT